MKKFLILLLTLTLTLGVFASCNSKRYLPIDETSSSPSEDTTSETNEIENITTKVITEDTIPDIDSEETKVTPDEETMYYSNWQSWKDQPYDYGSYEQLISDFESDKSRLWIDKEKWGVRFSKFIDALSARKSVPLIDSKISPTQMPHYKDHIITIFPNDSYSLPWIWYHCDYNDM